jgi:hypothetical protein
LVLSRPFGSPFWNRTTSALSNKVLLKEKFATEIFFPQVPPPPFAAPRKHGWIGGERLQSRRLFNGFRKLRTGDEGQGEVRQRTISREIKNL